MKKTVLKLNAAVVIQLESGETDAIVTKEGIFIKFSDYPQIPEDVPEKGSAKEPMGVVDDTKVVEPPKSKRGRSSRKDEPKEIPVEEWENLEIGTKILVTLDMDGYRERKISAEVIEQTESATIVRFHEDGESDALRDTDKVFEFAIKM
jgi:hypothetical protein